MGTDKRERQKANRQQRLEEMAKEQQRAKTKKRGLQIGLVVAAAVVLALLFSIFGGSNDDSVVTTTTLADGASTTVSTASSASTQAALATVPGQTITGATECPAADGSSQRTIEFAEAPPMCIDPAKTYSAVVTTNLGKFTIELDTATAPQTVNNFVVLARYHYFDNTTCPRAVPAFVVQCGSTTGTTVSDPGYTIPDELPDSIDVYTRGAVAMANTNTPDTGGAQFFIVTSDTGGAALGTPIYSKLGEVTTGLDPTVTSMAALATPSEVPSGLIQINTVEITEV